MMATVRLKQQQYGELIAPETIHGVAKAIAENFHPEKIILFGSYATGTPTPDSDLDFLVVMDSDQPRYKRSVPIRLMFDPVPCAMDIRFSWQICGQPLVRADSQVYDIRLVL